MKSRGRTADRGASDADRDAARAKGPGEGTPAGRDPESRPVVFYDGECRLCNGLVRTIRRADRNDRLRFVPLQDEAARRALPPPPEDPREWSIVFLDEEGVHDQSDALIAVLRRLGGAGSLLGLARYIPARIRDPIYRLIARHRSRFFGRRPGDRS